MALYVGLDIGGTKFMAASSDDSGHIKVRTRQSTPHDLKYGLIVLRDMIQEVAGKEKIDGIGAAIGGPLDWRQGVVSPLHQPTWRDVPLKAIMESEWHCPFNVDVDTNVAALGEYTFGGETSRHFLYITVSTGLGGGYLIDGIIYRGMHGEHPEIGHQSINYRCSNPADIGCECGAPDCLEALVSGNGIQRIYHKPAHDLNEEEWKEVTFNLGQGLRNLATIYLPDLIVLGGGIALGRGNKLINGIHDIMKKRLNLVSMPRIRLSQLGNDTALMGALVIAKQGVTNSN
jgi:glucokinase